MSHERNLRYLISRRIIYRRDPIDDKPTESFDWGDYYQEGTYECYTLFRSRGKITTYKSLKWHLLVLWYLNPKLDQSDLENLANHICKETNGFVTFNISEHALKHIIYEVSMCDLETPPNNKLRKIIFRDNCLLTPEQKMSIVGSLIGKSKTVTEDDIYQCMLDINDMGNKITITKIAALLKCSTRTIHRNMGYDLKKEKELLNQQLKQ
jgi:hypothetical protein